MTKNLLFLFSLILISIVSYASFPVVNENLVIEEGNNINNTINVDPFIILGWIALSCLVFGGIFMALQPILAPGALYGGYIIIGMILGGVGGMLGLIWIFSRFKWGRKYWWALILGLLLIQIISDQSMHP